MPIISRDIGNSRQSIGIDLGKCVEFNKSGIDSVLSYTTPAAITNATPFTFAVWFNPSLIDTTDSRIIEQANGLTVILNNTGIFCRVTHATTNGQMVISDNSIKINDWNRLVVIWDNSYNYPQAYLNGVQVTTATTDKVGARLNPSGQTAYLGNRSAADRPFYGKLDKQEWYSRVWTEDEIQKDWQTTQSPTDSKLVQFDFEESSGDPTDSIDSITSTISNVTQNLTSFVIGTRSTVADRFIVPLVTQKSLQLNGTSDYAQTDIVPATDGWSMGFWVYIRSDAIAGTDVVVSYLTAASTNGFRLNYNANNVLGFAVFNSTTAVVNTGSSAGTFFRNKWYFVTVTYAVDNFKAFVNSVQVATDTSCTMAAAAGQVLTLGRRSYANSSWLHGSIKNFTFQNTTTPWTTTQIADLYYRNTIPTGATQWSMNDVATDQNGENALTLTGTSYSTDVPPHMGIRTAV